MPTVRKAEALIPLQELDLRIHEFRVEREEKPRQLSAVETKLERARENVEAIQAEIKEIRLESSKRELAVKEYDEKISKLQSQSLQARKNEEYQAFMKEISGIKADRDRVEDGLLDLYMQIDEKGKLEKLRKEELAQAQAVHDAEKKRIESEIQEVDRQIEELGKQRTEQASGIDAELLRLYQRVLNAKEDGKALSVAGKFETIEPEGKVIYWQCEGCGVALTPQDVNELLAGRKVLMCRNCSRILYLLPES